MFRPTKTCAILILAVLVVSILASESRAISPTKITEVKISEDLRRVIVKANGPLNPVQSGCVESPSRLAIHVPDAGLGDLDHIISNPDNGALLVRVSSSRAGVQLVLDFGKAAVPDYRVRLMDNCLIVLLGAPGTQPAGAQQPSFSSAAGAAGSPPPHAVQSSRHLVETESNDRADLSVCSAEVINGRVVLHVASKKRPGRTYRVDLGLNLDYLGFQSASISRVRERSGHPSRATGAKSASAVSATKPGDKPAVRRLRELPRTQAASRVSEHHRWAQRSFERGGSDANGEPRY